MGLSAQAKTAARPERPGYYRGSWINILLRVSWILLSAASWVSSHGFANVLGFALHLRLHSLARSPAALVFAAAAAVEEVVASVRRTCAEELPRPRRSHPFHGWLHGVS